MKPNLKNRPDPRRWKDAQYDKEMEEWFRGFEKKFWQMDFAKWYLENLEAIMQRFNLHSTSGVTQVELLKFFVEKEIFGEVKS